MKPRISCVTLGASDLARARTFYVEGLGFPAVDRTMEAAARAGAKIVKPAQETFCGGYAGYFADPDGFLWEIAHHPGWGLDDAGRIKLDR